MKLYWLFRPEILLQPKTYKNILSQNWVYSPCFYFNTQYQDLILEKEFILYDNIVPEDKYNEEKLPWIPLLRRMFEIDYNMDYAKVESILNDFKWFNFQFLTNEEMIAWIKANTSLQEVSQWKFLIYPEATWIDWEIIEAEFLTIE